MTLNRYNELMSHIELSDEDRAKILENVKAAESSNSNVTNIVKRAAPFAAAAVVLLAFGFFTVGDYINKSKHAEETVQAHSEDISAAEPETADELNDAAVCEEFDEADSACLIYTSIDEINEASGLNLTDLDFGYAVSDVSYSYDGSAVVIEYSNDNPELQAVYTVAPGSEKAAKKFTIEEENGYITAAYSDGTYAYVIESPTLTAEEMEGICRAVLENIAQ